MALLTFCPIAIQSAFRAALWLFSLGLLNLSTNHRTTMVAIELSREDKRALRKAEKRKAKFGTAEEITEGGPTPQGAKDSDITAPSGDGSIKVRRYPYVLDSEGGFLTSRILRRRNLRSALPPLIRNPTMLNIWRRSGGRIKLSMQKLWVLFPSRILVSARAQTNLSYRLQVAAVQNRLLLHQSSRVAQKTKGRSLRGRNRLLDRVAR